MPEYDDYDPIMAEDVDDADTVLILHVATGEVMELSMADFVAFVNA